jgi:redox-sensitive bicupin YhaK (pirin superfamily)
MEIIRSEERGFFDHGWLKTYHTFSFADYYNPNKMNFGLLRVMNDDVLAGNQGFGMHPHKNMEIITVPLSGSLSHEDSTGQKGVISPGDVQVMSAGKGVMHSERNPSGDPGNFLQIWIFTGIQEVTPRYDQKRFDSEAGNGKMQLLVSPDGRDNSLWIYQNAFISRMSGLQSATFDYKKFDNKNGLLLYVIKGQIKANTDTLNNRDTLLIYPDEYLEFLPEAGSDLLFIEVPLE